MAKKYDLQKLTAAELSEILSFVEVSGEISLQDIQEDIAAGCPKNPDGTINLYAYAGWLCGGTE